jgi:hypothetical protein
LFALPKPAKVHLLVGSHVLLSEVSHAVSCDQMTDFFGEVLGVIPHALQSLRHHQDVDAGAGEILTGLEVAHEDEVAQPVHAMEASTFRVANA